MKKFLYVIVLVTFFALAACSEVEVEESTAAMNWTYGEAYKQEVIQHILYIDAQKNENVPMTNTIIMYMSDTFNKENLTGLMDLAYEMFYDANQLVEEQDEEDFKRYEESYKQHYDELAALLDVDFSKEELDRKKYEQHLQEYIEYVQAGDKLYKNIKAINFEYGELNLKENVYGTVLYTGAVKECDYYGFYDSDIDDPSQYRCIDLWQFNTNHSTFAFIPVELAAELELNEYSYTNLRMTYALHLHTYTKYNQPAFVIKNAQPIDYFDERIAEYKNATTPNKPELETAENKPIYEDDHITQYIESWVRPYWNETSEKIKSGELQQESNGDHETYVDKNGAVQKIVAQSQPEKMELLISEGEIVFVFTVNELSGEENRYYFYDGQLGRWQKPDGSIIQMKEGYEQESYKTKEREILDVASVYLK